MYELVSQTQSFKVRYARADVAEHITEPGILAQRGERGQEAFELYLS